MNNSNDVPTGSSGGDFAQWDGSATPPEPSPTGEWTAKDFELLCASDAALRAKQVNAALAAERDAGFEECRHLWKRNVADLEAKYQAQLAAEREKVKPLVEMLREIDAALTDNEMGRIRFGLAMSRIRESTDAALAEVKEGK